MNLFDRYANLFARVPGLAKALPRRIVAAVVALLAIVLTIWLLATLIPLLPARFWQLVGLCLVALGVLWWFTLGAKRFSRAGLSKKRIGDLGPGNPDDEREPLARMSQAINEARNTILRSPQIESGKDPIYRVPWLLFVGDSASDVAGLLKAANTVSPFPPPTQPEGDPKQVWRWWFFKSLIAIEMHARVVCDPSARLERGLWYQALMQLAAKRERLPLNGIVLCVSARSLLGPADELKALSLRLRRLVDEAMEHLQANMPVYVVVTGLEALTGYASFRAALPKEAFDQALGHRLPETEVISAQTSTRLDEILQPILDRLHALRLSALRSQPTPQTRRDVFEFIEQLRRMQFGLGNLVTLLLEDNPFQRTPRWRGLYFTGAGSGDHAGGAFVADLFTRFLPTDQPLATPSLRGNSARLSIAAFGVLAMLGLSASISLGFSAAHRDDVRLQAQLGTACDGLAGDGARGSRIAALASCGRSIQQLQVAADQALLGFGIRRSDNDLATLKQAVVDGVSNLILAPYDQAIEADLAAGRVGFDHVLAISQRLRMLADCRRRTDDCLQRELPHNVAFDPASRLFAPFASSDDNVRTDRENSAALLSTYLGYLRWQKRDVLNAEDKRLKALLARIMTAYTPRPEDIERWSAARGDGLRLTRFWLPEDRVVGVDDASLPMISGAYTLDVYQGVLAPMIATVDSALPEKKSVLADLRRNYFAAYFRSWAAFQARFGEGLKLWQGQYDRLVAVAATHQNPYPFFFAGAQRDLFGLPLDLPIKLRWSIAWAQIRSNWLGVLKPLWRFIVDAARGAGPNAIDPPPWLLAMKDTEVRVLRKQAPALARGYLRLQAEGGGQDIYQIAADIFKAQGAPTQPPAAEYAQMLAAVDKPDERYSAQFRNADLAAWSVVQGQARLLLFLTVYRAGQFVQAKWRETVAQPLQNASPQELASLLYGEQGKLTRFVADWLKPFLSERDNAPIKVAGVSMPLSTGFQAALMQQRSAAAVPGAGKPFLAAGLQFTDASRFGSYNEGGQGTTIEVQCQDRTFSASTRSESLADARVAVMWSPDSCLEARLRIALPDPAEVEAGVAATGFDPTAAPVAPASSNAPTRLIKVYPGGDGLIALASDFAEGQKRFRLTDFESAYTPSQWNELLPRLRALGTREVQVYLDVQLSDEMKRYLASRSAPTSLPPNILN
ncbi:type VI secretion system protein [Hydrocarboniphaga effusa]|uniref:type VI secretion system protein n=1 Tax=Hydrocarboniphaga effusa TaxID=243629 RepID=UPI003137DD7B